jgi:hypothetical protein
MPIHPNIFNRARAGLFIASLLLAGLVPGPVSASRSSASYIADPEIRWKVSVINSPDTSQRFSREPVYFLNIGAD